MLPASTMATDYQYVNDISYCHWCHYYRCGVGLTLNMVLLYWGAQPQLVVNQTSLLIWSMCMLVYFFIWELCTLLEWVCKLVIVLLRCEVCPSANLLMIWFVLFCVLVSSYIWAASHGRTMKPFDLSTKCCTVKDVTVSFNKLRELCMPGKWNAIYLFICNTLCYCSVRTWYQECRETLVVTSELFSLAGAG